MPAAGAGDQAFHSAAYKGLSASGNVKTNAAGVLHSLDLSNLDAAAAFLQIFDATSHAAVVLGSTVPALTVKVPSSGEKELVDLDFGFNSGCVFAVTTTDGGAVSPATGFAINATYQ